MTPLDIAISVMILLLVARLSYNKGRRDERAVRHGDYEDEFHDEGHCR
jgi:hypothetical protein